MSKKYLKKNEKYFGKYGRLFLIFTKK